jgi:hypothetical protein
MENAPAQVGALRPAEYNPRRISEDAFKKLQQALEVFGDLGGVVFNRRTGNLVGGHQRVKALDKSWKVEAWNSSLTDGDRKVGTVALGFIFTPFGRLAYREVDWSENIEKAANIAANKHGGEWDDGALKELLVQLDDGSGLLELTGFGSVELSGLIQRGEAELPDLPSEKEKLFEQVTFTVTPEQAKEVRAALSLAIAAGDFGDTGNENRNGNALARIAKNYRGGK